MFTLPQRVSQHVPRFKARKERKGTENANWQHPHTPSSLCKEGNFACIHCSTSIRAPPCAEIGLLWQSLPRAIVACFENDLLSPPGEPSWPLSSRHYHSRLLLRLPPSQVASKWRDPFLSLFFFLFFFRSEITMTPRRNQFNQ